MLPNSLSNMAGPLFPWKILEGPVFRDCRFGRYTVIASTCSRHSRLWAVSSAESEVWWRKANLCEMSTSQCNVLLWSVEERRQEKVRVTARAKEDGSLAEAPGLRTVFGGKLKWRYHGSMIPFRLKSVPETQACSVSLELLSARLLPISFTIPQPRKSLATAH